MGMDYTKIDDTIRLFFLISKENWLKVFTCLFFKKRVECNWWSRRLENDQIFHCMQLRKSKKPQGHQAGTLLSARQYSWLNHYSMLLYNMVTPVCYKCTFTSLVTVWLNFFMFMVPSKKELNTPVCIGSVHLLILTQWHTMTTVIHSLFYDPKQNQQVVIVLTSSWEWYIVRPLAQFYDWCTSYLLRSDKHFYGVTNIQHPFFMFYTGECSLRCCHTLKHTKQRDISCWILS
jgi:hypothetical protein